jgi:hypothetical protein
MFATLREEAGDANAAERLIDVDASSSPEMILRVSEPWLVWGDYDADHDVAGDRMMMTVVTMIWVSDESRIND